MSSDLALIDIRPLSEREERWVNAVKDDVMKLPQMNFPTHSFLHAGIYTRTVVLPPDAVLVGAKIKIDTLLITQGHCLVNINEQIMEVDGYHIFRAAAGRRQFFRSFSETYITMNFATQSTDLAECEKEFTDEWEQLLTNKFKEK